MSTENTIKIYVYEILHSRDGGDYDLNRADLVRIIEAPKLSYFEARERALVVAGTHLDTDGGLVAIRDEINGTHYYHFHGMTGEVTRFVNATTLRKHLREKCRGMRLIGRWRD